MKKFLIMALFLLLVFTSCVGLPVIYQDGTNGDNNTNTPSSPIVTEGSVKTGLAIMTNISKSAGQTAEYDITLVAVTVDESGVIRACQIDSVGTSVKFDTTGVITTDITKAVQSKQELGDAYNMVLYGGAKYEWYEQVNALAQYCVGKTAEEVAGISVDASTKPTDTDLASSVTISIAGYKNAIVKAVNNAKALGAKATDTLHLAVNTNLKSSKNATADKKGVAQCDLDVMAVTEYEGYITSCALDSVQAKVEFDTTGTITTDLTKAVESKQELGDRYNMVLYGGAKYEWYVQADSFCKYVKGKTAEEVANISVNESTYPTDPDLPTSVTIAIGGYKALVAEALDGVEVGSRAVKTGLAIMTNLSKSAGQTVEFDITIVAVTVDYEGIITSCKIDSVGTSVKFDTTGVITTDITKAVQSKQELGDAYNMVLYGGAKYEWYEQANALAQYCVGKTAEEVAGISVDASTKPTDTDLASSVTISIAGYKNAIVKAVNNAKDLGAKSTDTLRLAVNANVKSSANATTEKAGLAQCDLDVIALTEKNGVITSCTIDSVQAKVNFDTTGTITTDLNKVVETKQELGDRYNMVLYGGAKYEWYVQTDSFCKYVKGKTAEEVANISVNESTYPTDPDLPASVTIAIGGYKALVAEALA